MGEHTRCDVIIEHDTKPPFQTRVFINGREVPRLLSLKKSPAAGGIITMTFEVAPTSFNGIDYGQPKLPVATVPKKRAPAGRARKAQVSE
jgi:hypothetical protein